MDLKNPTPAAIETIKVDPQARKVKVLTAVSVIVFVTSSILTGCLVYQKKEHQRIIQEREEKESILAEQLKQAEGKRIEDHGQWNTERGAWDEERTALEQERDLARRHKDREVQARGEAMGERNLAKAEKEVMRRRWCEDIKRRDEKIQRMEEVIQESRGQSARLAKLFHEAERTYKWKDAQTLLMSNKVKEQHAKIEQLLKGRDKEQPAEIEEKGNNPNYYN